VLPERPGWPTARAVRIAKRFVWPVVRVWHRPSLEGEEHLPEGPYVLVANHPPSVGAGEFLSFAACWTKRFDGQRPLAAFVHALGYDLWPISRIFREVGAIPSTYTAAAAGKADPRSFVRASWRRGSSSGRARSE